MPEPGKIATAPGAYDWGENGIPVGQPLWFPARRQSASGAHPLTGERRLRPFGSAGCAYGQAKNSRTSLTNSALFSISGRWPL
jgi:hypothetical protein